MKTFKVRFWMEILAAVSAVACAVAVFLASVGAAAGPHAAEPVATSQTAQVQASQVQASQVQASQVQSSQVQASSIKAGVAPGVPLQTYEGVITETRCGAKHSAAIAKTAADCTRACVHSGEQFALVDGDTMYVLEGEALALKRAAGERVKIAGMLNGKTISVTSVGAPTS